MFPVALALQGTSTTKKEVIRLNITKKHIDLLSA